MDSGKAMSGFMTAALPHDRVTQQGGNTRTPARTSLW